MKNALKYSRFSELVRYIASQIPGIKTLQLVKTIYLLELEYIIKFGENLTEVPIVRLPMGPVSSNYKSHFKRLIANKLLEEKKRGRGIQYFAKPSDHFLSIELDIFQPFIKLIRNIIDQQPYGATEIIKGLSYQTFPMERFVKQEKKDNEFHLGWKVLQPPYFTDQDIDPLAKERRALRNHLKKAYPFGHADMNIGLKIADEMVPYLKASNFTIPDL